jgi:hypothetical protein
MSFVSEWRMTTSGFPELLSTLWTVSSNVKALILETETAWVNTNQLLRDDKFHLSPKGTSILATNLKNALHYVLNIKPPGNTSYPKHRDADKNFHTPYNNKGLNTVTVTAGTFEP